jgi:hypothetical protein
MEVNTTGTGSQMGQGDDFGDEGSQASAVMGAGDDGFGDDDDEMDAWGDA